MSQSLVDSMSRRQRIRLRRRPNGARDERVTWLNRAGSHLECASDDPSALPRMMARHERGVGRRRFVTHESWSHQEWERTVSLSGSSAFTAFLSFLIAVSRVRPILTLSVRVFCERQV